MAGATAVLLATSIARADPATSFELAWSAPERCTSREGILDATRARLVQSHVDMPAELFVVGTVRKERGGYFVALQVKDAAGKAVGEREVFVEGTSCTAVEEAAALVLTMMIAAIPPPEPAPAPEEVEVKAPADAPAPATPPKASSAPRAHEPSRKIGRPRLTLGAAAAASFGLLPDAGLGVALRAAYSPNPVVWLGLEATFEAGGSIRAAQREVGFQFLHAAAFAGARVLRIAVVEVIATAALRAGAIRVLPDGFAVVEREARAAVVGGPGALVRTRLAPHVFLEALPELDVVFIRDTFEIRDGAQVPIHRPNPLAARLSLGFGYEF